MLRWAGWLLLVAGLAIAGYEFVRDGAISLVGIGIAVVAGATLLVRSDEEDSAP